MKEEISEYYKNKGWKCVYINTNKEPRRVATLHKFKCNKSMSYAKYLYTSYYKCDIEEGYEIDHINGNKMDDRIENLQLLSKNDNNKKDRPKAEMIELECPVCHKKFMFYKRNLPFKNNPCCSRKCGEIKSHWNLKNK